MLSDPRILLMDEPLAALDEARKAEILPYLERLRDEIRIPILYVSHSPSEVARLATTVPARADCFTYFKIENGKITTNWPGYATEYMWRTKAVKERDFEFVGVAMANA